MELKKQMFGFRRRLQPISPSKKMIATADHEREESYGAGIRENRNTSGSTSAHFSSLQSKTAPSYLGSHLYPGAQSLQQQVRLINISGNPNEAPPGHSIYIPGNLNTNKPAYPGLE